MRPINKLLIMIFVFVMAGLTMAQETALDQSIETLDNVAGRAWTSIQAAAQGDITRVILIIGGAVLLFMGWRIYNVVIQLAGILVGALIVSSFVPNDNTIINIAALLIGGAIGGFLAMVLYYGVIFIIGAYVGSILAIQVVLGLNLAFDLLLVSIFGGIMGGIILLGLSFEFLVILASIVGAQLLVLGLGLGAGWVLILFVVGVIIQITLARSFGYRIRRRPTRRLLWR